RPDSVIGVLVTDLVLKLNALTKDYNTAVEAVLTKRWSARFPERTARARSLLQVELDALAALSANIPIDDLIYLYYSQFPIEVKNSHHEIFDANGRLVPKEIVKAEEKTASGSKGTPESLTEAERTWTHPQSGVEYVFEYPFKPMDREAELRKAYAKYEAVLAESEK